MFDERESRRITNYRDESLKNSKTGKRTSRNIKGRKKVRILPLLLSGVIFVTGFKAGRNYEDYGDNKVAAFTNSLVEVFDADKYLSIWNFKSEYHINNMNKSIGSLVFEKDEDYLENIDTTEVPIANQCYWENFDGTNYKGGYYHDKIAKKILELDDQIEDYALFGVIYDMNKSERVNEIFDSNMNKTNGDYLIQLLSERANSESEKEAYEGVTTLDEYMKKHGYVDKDGNASLNEWWKISDKNAEVIKAQVDQELENRGLNK